MCVCVRARKRTLFARFNGDGFVTRLPVACAASSTSSARSLCAYFVEAKAKQAHLKQGDARAYATKARRQPTRAHYKIAKQTNWRRNSAFALMEKQTITSSFSAGGFSSDAK